MKIDGGCHCGRITYEAEIDPANVAICHCTDCQALSGTAFRTIGTVPEKDFKILSGEPKIYIKLGSTGARRAQAFCENCGSPIYACPDDPGPKVINIRLGTLKERDSLVPKRQVWGRSAQPWVGLESIPKQEKQSH